MKILSIKMKSASFYLFILLAASTSWAQKASPSPSVPPLPSGPLLKRAPDFSQWVAATLHVLKKPAKPEAALDLPVPSGKETPRRVFVTKTGEMRHVVTVEPNGSSSDLWFKEEMEVVCMPGWKYPYIANVHDPRNPFAKDFSRTDFPECGWISAKNYQGIQKVSGRDCILFGEKVKVVADPDAPAPIPPQTSSSDEVSFSRAAVVDLETRLPVTEITGDEITTYQFGPAPQSMLTFPKAIQDTIDARDAELKRETSAPPRPTPPQHN